MSKSKALPMIRDKAVFRPNVPRDWSLISPGLRQTLDDLGCGKAEWPLYLWGPTGTGKTCAALCLYDKVPDVLWREAEQLEAAAFEREAPQWRWFQDARLTIVDEIGAREGKRDDWGFQREALLRAWRLREFKPSIWISNLRGEDLDASDPHGRLYSRLCSGTVRELAGRDRRFDSP